MLAFLFIDSPREYLTAFLIVFGVCCACSLLFVLTAICAYKLSTRDGGYGKHWTPVPARLQEARAFPVDFSAVIKEHLALKERHEEERLLGRAA